MKASIFAVIWLILFCVCLSTLGQQQLFLAGHERELQDGVSQFLSKENIGFIYVIYEEAIDPEHDGRLNANLLEIKIESLFPDPNIEGYACLDWETPVVDIIYFQKPGFEAVIDEMKKAIMLAKKLRPKMKWGYYGLNKQEYYLRNNDWRNRSALFMPVIDASDVIYPSIYLFYPERINGKDFEISYAKDNTSLNLELCASAKKPIIPFVWHRWHDGDKEFGMHSIAPNEFGRHVKIILQETYQLKRVDGIAMWCMDKYFVTANNVVKQEMGNMRPESYRMMVIKRYLTIIQNALNNN